MLETGGYHVLVLQQGPSTLPESQVNLREWTITWAAQARRFGTRPSLYMIWPVRTQANGFALVSQSYRNAALAADTALFPAGEAWQQALRANPSIGLYDSDDLHPTPAGSFLAAMVIARGLAGLDPARVPATVRDVHVTAATLATFRAIVETLPATVMEGDANPATPPVIPAGPDSSPAGAAPAATGNGGGATSGWFLLALLIAGASRRRRRRER